MTTALVIQSEGFHLNFGLQVERHIWLQWRARLSLWLAALIFLAGVGTFGVALSQPLAYLQWLPLSLAALVCGQIQLLNHIFPS
jgi:hypothetical protein